MTSLTEINVGIACCCFPTFPLFFLTISSKITSAASQARSMARGIRLPRLKCPFSWSAADTKKTKRSWNNPYELDPVSDPKAAYITIEYPPKRTPLYSKFSTMQANDIEKGHHRKQDGLSDVTPTHSLQNLNIEPTNLAHDRVPQGTQILRTICVHTVEQPRSSLNDMLERQYRAPWETHVCKETETRGLI